MAYGECFIWQHASIHCMPKRRLPANLIQLLKLMSNGRFHSGEGLAARFEVSRATIFNLLRQAEHHGVRVHAVRGKGYRLASTFSWLDHALLESEIGRLGLGYSLLSVEETESTNTQLVAEAIAGAPHRTVLYTDYQHAGRGRRGRSWESPLGGGLAFSVLWRFDRGVSQLSGLSVVVGLALARAVGKISPIPVQLKWPNDLLAGYRKLAGILVEVQGEMAGPSFAVIGIGLNEFLSGQQREEIDQAVVDLAELGVRPSRADLMLAILTELSELMDIFEQVGLQPLIKEWSDRHAHEGREVALRLPDGSIYPGIANGLDEHGNLLLTGANGELRRFAAGEVSLRAVSRR
jgi:BirA family transcriptional regulator, biotin operon repressor / biotin---[acetyl-CoA-carboxylase] ligase